jgi:2-octaprenyl-6-methoxyphenol hydroxylase
VSARTTSRCDVAIAGGGMVGLSLAAALAGLPLDVVVIEPVAAGADEQPSFDSRTTALSSGSRRVLEGIGVWTAIAGQATPIRRIHVSERGVFGTATLTAEEQGVPSLGYTIENRLLGKALRERVAAFPRIQVRDSRVAGLEPGKDHVRLRSDAGETLEARLAVAADGAQSAVRAALGIEASVSDYGQHAIVAHVDTTRFHDYTAYERFTPDGPLAVLPIMEGRSAVVWTLAPDAARRVLALDDPAFLAELQGVFGQRLGRFTRVGRRQSYALALTLAERLTAPRAAILGNAAQALHPVAGQGFNLALRDVAMLAELIAAADDGDPGAASLLERYADWRGPDRNAVIRFTDALIRGFGLPLAPIRYARGGGLIAFDLLRPVKREFARRTMGLAGRQPRLVRGLPLLRA